MQIIDKTLHLPTESLESLALYTQQSIEHFCVFDIETTGLSPKISSLYLIGALWYDRDQKQFCIRQWFADDYISEVDILQAFGQFLEPFTLLVHYNGSGFDIPYIEKKCRELNVDIPFHKIQNLDIYREIRRLKSLFPAPDLKLPTVERLTGFMRKDVLSGRDCIDIYSQFMQKKILSRRRNGIGKAKAPSPQSGGSYRHTIFRPAPKLQKPPKAATERNEDTDAGTKGSYIHSDSFPLSLFLSPELGTSSLYCPLGETGNLHPDPSVPRHLIPFF